MKSFLRRILATTLLFPFASSSANAQNPSPAKTEVQKEVDALRAYMTSRLNFVKEHYALDAAKTAQIEGWMDSLISQQKAYNDLNALTLRRRERVLSSMLSQLSGASEQTKSQIASRMQAQIYAIHTAAPLSLANFARQSESILTPDMVDLGRKLIISKYPHVFPTGVFNVDLLEKIITPPIELGSGTDPLASRAVPQPPNPAKARAIEEARSSGAEAMPPDKSFNRDIRSAAAESSVATKPQPEAQSPPPPAVVPPTPPKPLMPAPPIDEWTHQIHSRIEAYGFTDAQRQTADAILASCSTRARAYLESVKSDIEKANNLTDEVAKARTLRSLTKEVDKLYGELTGRIESVATIEQRQKIESSRN